MYGLASWELEGMDKHTLFLHKITYLVGKITIRRADDTTMIVTGKRVSYTKQWSIGKRKGLFTSQLFDHLNDILFSDYNGRSPIVSIISQGFQFENDHTEEYNVLYTEYLTWMYEGD